MIISKADNIKLNYFAHGQGAEALEFLADLLWVYYSKEAVYCALDQKEHNSGKAQLATWLKALPKGLQDGRDDALRG